MTTRAYTIEAGRHIIRAEDVVRVTPGGSDRRGYRARLKWAEVDDDGGVVSVTVFGGPGFDPDRPASQQTGICQWRTYCPDRVTRVP